MTTIDNFIKGIPKAELHVHIEGTFEPELMFDMARRNNKELKYKSVKDLKKAYDFSNLQDFLNIYYQGTKVLTCEQDFYDLTRAYLKKAHGENILHTEIFFDPQTHTDRGIAFQTVVQGISRALQDGEKELGISSRLIMCFLRHLDEDDAFKTLHEALPFKHLITAVGLDSSEVGHPPSKFRRVFEQARNAGFLTVAHAGEEGPAEYVREALDMLKISRIDHGNRSLDDDNLVHELVVRKIPLTVCPLSNFRLKVVRNPGEHPLSKMLDLGLLATVNSDDPAYFGGYVNENYIAVARALNLSGKDIVRLAKNSFTASFLDDNTKQLLIGKTDKYCQENL
jgi:adenine deaminase